MVSELSSYIVFIQIIFLVETTPSIVCGIMHH